VETLLPNGAKK